MGLPNNTIEYPNKPRNAGPIEAGILDSLLAQIREVTKGLLDEVRVLSSVADRLGLEHYAKPAEVVDAPKAMPETLLQEFSASASDLREVMTELRNEAARLRRLVAS